MKLRELIPLRYRYLISLRWSHTVVYLAELSILLFLTIQRRWIPLALFLTVFLLEEYVYSKKISKLEEAARING